MSLKLTQTKVTVATAGTAEQVSSINLRTPSVIVTADPANTGRIWVGDSSVDAASSLGTPIGANETIEIAGTNYDGTGEVIDLLNLYVDAEVDGESAIVSYYERVKDQVITFFPNVKSLSFDGVNEAVNCGNNYDPDETQPESWSFWLKPDDLAAQRHILSKMGTSGNIDGLGIYQRATTGNIFIQYRAGASQNRFWDFSSAVTAGVWNHLVCTYSGNSNMNGWEVYINGVASGDTVTSGSVSNGVGNNGDLLFGRRSASFYYLGNMNNIARYDKELSSVEVNEIYNFGVPVDLTDLSTAANLTSWWKLNNDINFPIEVDAVGSIDGTLENMTASNYEEDVP